jgi:hypothetical protein
MPAARDDGSVRAAFSTTPEMFDDPATTFELELPGGDAIRLPPPIERAPLDSRRREDNRPRSISRRGTAGVSRGRTHRPPSFEQELEAIRRHHADLLVVARREHDLELQAVRDEVDATHRELAAAVGELEAANAQHEALRGGRSAGPDATGSHGGAPTVREAELEQELAAAARRRRDGT